MNAQQQLQFIADELAIGPTLTYYVCPGSLHAIEYECVSAFHKLIAAKYGPDSWHYNGRFTIVVEPTGAMVRFLRVDSDPEHAVSSYWPTNVVFHPDAQSYSESGFDRWRRAANCIEVQGQLEIVA